ncbi:MAG: alanine racemase, partial [Acidimicrobiia bacterium]
MTDSSLGLPIEAVPTPSLLLDLDAFDRNVRKIAHYLDERGVAWRPHVKGHKSPILANRMVEAGAIGVTCAKVSEAEVMVASGIDEILIANQPATSEAWERVARLQGAASVAVAIDHAAHVRLAREAASGFGVTIPLVIEVEIGMNRAGVRSTAQGVDLAREIVDGGQVLAGVMGDEGHLLTA